MTTTRTPGFQYDAMVSAHRVAMVAYLGEAFGIIQQALSEADFEEAFPHVWGHPENNPTLAVRNKCGLLLRKAELHLLAVLRADDGNNLHSLAIHLRIIMECTAHLVPTTGLTGKESPKAFQKNINNLEYDILDTVQRAGRGMVENDEIMNIITKGRRSIGDYRDTRPTRVTIRDRIKVLPNGEWWYQHLSTHFRHGHGMGTLDKDSFHGGAMSAGTLMDELALVLFLEYAVELAIYMLLWYELLLLVISDDPRTQPYDNVAALWERAKATVLSFRETVQQVASEVV